MSETAAVGRALVVYESMWGNTEQIAEAIASGLGRTLAVEVAEVTSAPPEPGPEIDLIVVGGPTHAFSMSRDSTRAEALNRGAGHGRRDIGLRDWLEALPRRHRRQQMVSFDTRVEKMRHLPGSAARSAARVAHRRGFDRAEDVRSFYVVDLEGPLVEGEVERAEAWGRQLGADVAHHAL